MDDEWIDGWLDGWMDGWMNGWMMDDEWIDGWLDGWMDRWMDGWVVGWVGGWMDGWGLENLSKRPHSRSCLSPFCDGTKCLGSRSPDPKEGKVIRHQKISFGSLSPMLG